jgi:hypothetical protein
MLRRETKQAIRRRFHHAMLGLQSRFGWKAKDIAAIYHLPYRSVANWLAGKAAPGPRRLRELCRVFDWQYDVMFDREAVEKEALESQELDLRILSEQYLRAQSRDPLEAWSYVSLAVALVFNKFSAWGFQSRATIDCNFRTRIQFLRPALARVSFQVGAVFGRGLVISWLDEQGLLRQTMALSDATMNSIKKELNAIAGL